jgi:RimJ/RimL family protein N-acetyltransferase
MKAPEIVETGRLVFRRPIASDLEAVFQRYASSLEVTRYVGWPRHCSLADTAAFLAFSDCEWERWPAGPYLVESRTDGLLLGSSGFAFETPYRAATGYVLATDAWGKGYATETLQAIARIAPEIGVSRLYALCHIDHRASWRVLEKCRFVREGTLRSYADFPNLEPDQPCDVYCYALVFDRKRE